MGNDSAEQEKQGTTKRQRISTRVASKSTKAQDAALTALVDVANGTKTAAQAGEELADLVHSEQAHSDSELADVLAVEAVAGPIAGDASNALDATPEQLGEVTSTKAPTKKQLDAALKAQQRLTASAQSNTDGRNDATLTAALATVTPANNPSDHVTGKALSTGSAEHTASIRAAGVNAPITSAIDKSFTAAVIGISPDALRVLVCVDNPGLTPHRHGQNVWLPVASVELLSAQQASKQKSTSKRARSQSAQSTSTDTSATPIEDNDMTTKSSTKKSTKTASKSTKSTKAQGTSTGKRAAKSAASASTTPKAKRGVMTSEALDALPQALRAGVEAVRLNWATEKWPKPKTLKFSAGATGGGYKAAGQVWGHIDVADTEFNKFWRFHFQQKGDKCVVNRTLSYDSVEAAKNAAEYCAKSLGVANPEHFTFKF